MAEEHPPRFSSPHGTPLPGALPPPDPKLNEVHGRISKDSTAVVVEVGRPGVSTTLADVEKVCMALAAAGFTFDPGSGVTGLMVDVAAGKLQPDILNERVMHAMIHYTCPNDHLPAGLRALREVAGRVNTVFSIGFSSLLDAEGIGPAVAICEEAGFVVKPHGKTSVGMASKNEVRS